MDENNTPVIETKNIATHKNRPPIYNLTVALACAVVVLLVLLALTLLIGGGRGDKDADKRDDIYVDMDGYVVVNGTRTEYKAEEPDVITVTDGFLVVNGVMTGYEVKPSSHIFDVWLPYGEKTLDCESTPHYRICSDCGFIEWREGEYADHSFELVNINATCKEVGYDFKTCTRCEKQEILNEVPKAPHAYGEYLTDGEFHWLACSECYAESEKESHELGEDGVCTVCSAAIGDTPGVVYDLSSDGTYALVVDYKGSSSAVKIASEYEGVPVKVIYDKAFYQNGRIKNVIIPDTVTEIGSWAFYECSALSEVVFGGSLEIIDSLAFCRTGLSEIILPDSLVEIRSDAFGDCRRLVSVKLGDGVQIIEQRAFSGCEKLKSVSVGKNVAYVGSQVFDGCADELFSEYNYGKYVGDGESSYRILIDVTNQSFTSYELHEKTTAIAHSAFNGCERLSRLELPDGLKGIGSEAFSVCSYFDYIYIPKSVTHLSGLYSPTVVCYEGSEEDWQSIKKYTLWTTDVRYNVNREDFLNEQN